MDEPLGMRDDVIEEYEWEARTMVSATTGERVIGLVFRTAAGEDCYALSPTKASVIAGHLTMLVATLDSDLGTE